MSILFKYEANRLNNDPGKISQQVLLLRTEKERLEEEQKVAHARKENVDKPIKHFNVLLNPDTDDGD